METQFFARSVFMFCLYRFSALIIVSLRNENLLLKAFLVKKHDKIRYFSHRRSPRRCRTRL